MNTSKTAEADKILQNPGPPESWRGEGGKGIPFSFYNLKTIERCQRNSCKLVPEFDLRLLQKQCFPWGALGLEISSHPQRPTKRGLYTLSLDSDGLGWAIQAGKNSNFQATLHAVCSVVILQLGDFLSFFFFNKKWCLGENMLKFPLEHPDKLQGRHSSEAARDVCEGALFARVRTKMGLLSNKELQNRLLVLFMSTPPL